jgi:nucleolar protein 9
MLTNICSFVPLVQHRFASHCCETLFERAAPIVSKELEKPSFTTDGSEPEPNMEDCFLEVVSELKEHLGWLMTDVFACHPLRVLLLVLSGQPIAQLAGKSGLHSKRKEHNQAVDQEDPYAGVLAAERAIPASFKSALETLISSSVAGLDTNSLRSLAAHRTGNPTLQLMLRLELTQFGKARAKDESSIIRLLIPEETLSPESPSSSFVVGLMYDPVGSRLLETIIEHAPAKTFKAIYRGFMKPKLDTIIKNDTAGYVLSKAIVRLGKEDLEAAINLLAPSIPSLVERNRLAIIRTLVDHSVYREAKTEALAKYLTVAYEGPNGFDINRLLQPSAIPDLAVPQNQQQPSNAGEKLHASLLAQSLLNAPAPLSPLILDALTTLPSSQLILLAQDTQASHTVNTALTSQHSPIISRRKLIAALYGHIAQLAIHPAGSRVIDALWSGTRGLAFMRERVAEELAEAESGLREAHYGKRVWRNWKMDMYRRRRREWVAYAKSSDAQGEEHFIGFPSAEANATAASGATSSATGHDRNGAQESVAAGIQRLAFVPGEKAKKHMTALEKARQRHAQTKASREKAGNTGPTTGANNVSAKAVVT